MTWLLVVSLVGLVLPNGLFLYWLFNEFQGLGAVWQDRLAMAFMLDALLVLVLLAVYFARRPIGRIRWGWFVALSIVGGLGFSLPFYYWLNVRTPAALTRGNREPESRGLP
jgi:hypothetical protein